MNKTLRIETYRYQAIRPSISQWVSFDVLILLFFIAAGASETNAQSLSNEEKKAQEKLEKIQNDIKATSAEKNTHQEQIKAAEDAVADITQQMIKLGTSLQLAEDNANRLETNIENLEMEEREKSSALKSRQQELSELLAALERLSRRPAVLSLLQPGEAISTARSASLMSTIVPQVNTKAELLKNELNALAIIQNNLIIERAELKVTLENLADDRLNLGQLVQERKQEIATVNQALRADEEKLQSLANEAKSLQDLLAKINQRNSRLLSLAAPNIKPTRPTNSGTPAGEKSSIIRTVPRSPSTGNRNFAAAKGLIPYPVSGSVISRFGEQDGVIQSRGIRIQGRSGGQVVSPYDGQIVFTGPFRNYGNLLIIEHGGGYHTLLAGLGQIYGTLGQRVLTGEPIGVLDSANNRPPPLYLELRRKGEAIDPLPWLRRQQASGR